MANPLRFLNPFYIRRLEREVAGIEAERAELDEERKLMVRAREGAKRAAQSFYDSIGRQAPAGSETAMRAEIVALEGRVRALETSAGLAVRYFDDGRYQSARRALSAILDTVPVDQREAS